MLPFGIGDWASAALPPREADLRFATITAYGRSRGPLIHFIAYDKTPLASITAIPPLAILSAGQPSTLEKFRRYAMSSETRREGYASPRDAHLGRVQSSRDCAAISRSSRRSSMLL